MKKILLFIVGVIILISSCKTKQYLMKSTDLDLTKIKSIAVVKNEFSYIIPAGIYPEYGNINDFVIKKEKAINNIADLICDELTERKINSKVINDLSEIEDNSYYIKYQDYWAWDFKTYMHVLKVRLYKSEKEIKSVVSQGNTAGMHDFPNPEKQVPLLINLLINE